jgi:hypothetical protein
VTGFFFLDAYTLVKKQLSTNQSKSNQKSNQNQTMHYSASHNQ